MTPLRSSHQQNGPECFCAYPGLNGLFRLNGPMIPLMGKGLVGRRGLVGRILVSTAMMLCITPIAAAETLTQPLTQPLTQTLAQNKIQLPAQIKALPGQQSWLKPETFNPETFNPGAFNPGISPGQEIVPSPANMPVPAPPPGLGRNRPQQQPTNRPPSPPSPSRWGIPTRRPAPAFQGESQKQPEVTPLRVPTLKIPVGNAGDRSDVLTITLAQMPWMSESATVVSAPLSASAAQSYQIVVETPDPITQAQIQAHIQWLVPGAFPTLLQGRRVIQVGHFHDLWGNDRPSADQLMQRLIQAGFWPRIYPQP